MTRKPKIRFAIVIEDDDPPPGVNDFFGRLRLLLKRMLRQHGLRCIDIRQEPATTAQTMPETPPAAPSTPGPAAITDPARLCGIGECRDCGGVP